MLSAKIEQNPSSPALGSLWFSGKKPKTPIAPMSARAQEIAKNREDLLGLLRDLPESEYELSLTDLVEKVSSDSADADPDKTSYDQKDSNLPRPLKERNQMNGNSRMRRSWSSSSGGVLLNMYTPTSLTRSLTGSRSGRRTASDGSRRDREAPPLLSCCSAIWNKVRGKSRKA